MSEPVIEVAQGRLRGGREEGVTVYRGVPFAAVPVGPLRFRAPRPAPPWSGIREARRSGPASYQVNAGNAEAVRRIVAEIDPGVPGIMAWPPYAGPTYQQDNAAEDCLYLDIWVPDVEPGQRLPVYVYFHGGANATSAGSFTQERGARLARTQRVIVVRPNYRMGALGWLHVGLVTDAVPEAVNLGIQDQLAALRWVHENIGAAAGDPERICIGGESAGGTAVSHLLGIPAARRLVRRAVIQSLSPFNPWCTQQRPDAEAVVGRYVQLLGLDGPADLVDVDADRLLAAANVLTRWFPPDAALAWRPLGGVADGNWVPGAPARLLAETDPGLGGVEVTIGFAKDEWMFFRGHSDTVDHGDRADVLAVLGQVFGASAPSVYDAFATLHPGHTPGHLLSDVMSMAYFKLSSLRIAQNLAAHGVPVRVFQFSYDLPGLDGRYRAVHTGDIPFLFGNQTEADLAAFPTFDGVDRAELARITDTAMNLYGAVIRGDDPGTAWPPFTERDATVLRLGDTVEPRPHLLDDELAAFVAHGMGTVADLEDTLVSNLRLAHRNATRSSPADPER